VHIQNPTCSFYATERDWQDRFSRKLKEDARPMLILAPMHPVMLVYALDETDGKDLPKELTGFATYQGQWKPDLLKLAIRNAAVRDRIRVDFKTLSSTNAGFATLAHSTDEWKMRIAIHSQLDEPSQYGILCHELAHIYLGHLGADEDHWWPSRTDLDGRALEIEAESTALRSGRRTSHDMAQHGLWSASAHQPIRCTNRIRCLRWGKTRGCGPT
jgi:hypothetical protein